MVSTRGPEFSTYLIDLYSIQWSNEDHLKAIEYRWLPERGPTFLRSNDIHSETCPPIIEAVEKGL